MIFGLRKKRQDEAEPTSDTVPAATAGVTEPAPDPVEPTELDDDADLQLEDGLDDDENEPAEVEPSVAADDDRADSADGSADDSADDSADGAAVVEEDLDVEFLDSQNWRTEGPWDDSEVDMEEFAAAVDVPRIDLGSIILTGTEGMDVQLQVAEDTQQIVSAMMMLGESVTVDGEVHELGSALEVAAFAAPRSGGYWPEIREELIEGADQAGGNAGLMAGPFGVELRRLLLVDTPDGEQGYQPSRMWVAEGPRWILRGVVYGHAALEGVPGGHAERIEDLFRQIVVRRGDEAMAPGDLLTLRLPENMVEEATEES